MSKVNLMNDKHYPDPTTHDALRKVLRDEKEIDERCRLLVSALRNVIELSGFELTNRIELKHIASGKEYK